MNSSSKSNVRKYRSEKGDDDTPPIKKSKVDDNLSSSSSPFDWRPMLKSNKDFQAASVSQIRHDPHSAFWDDFVTVGTKLEVAHNDLVITSGKPVYWVASVIKVEGFFALLRFEGCGNDPSNDFWIHPGSNKEVHSVGWCLKTGASLIQPRSIAQKITPESIITAARLDGKSLPSYFHTNMEESKMLSRYKIGDQVEVVDRNRISRVRVATVRRIIGRRLDVEYFDAKKNEDYFRCHEDSSLVHPKGWAKAVGHKILAPKEYNPQPHVFSKRQQNLDAKLKSEELFKVGMKLEVVDPLNLANICVATVEKVLKMGYIMVGVNANDKELNFNKRNSFCYHITSPYLLPCGFCKQHGITLQPPHGFKHFSWKKYLRKTGAEKAPIPRKIKGTEHGFKEGMRIEAADVMEPELIYPAKISRVVGNLLKINFEGWSEEFDYWMDARSPDIYPVGWCELIGHELESPGDPDEEPEQEGHESKELLADTEPPLDLALLKLPPKKRNRLFTMNKLAA